MVSREELIMALNPVTVCPNLPLRNRWKTSATSRLHS